MDATLLANNSQHCWMLHVVSVCTPCCISLDVVACCYAKSETGQTFQPTTPNISFVLWSPKRSPTIHTYFIVHVTSPKGLDPFAQLFQHCWATHAHCAWSTKTYGLYFSHDALQVPNWLGVIASVCTPLPTRTQQIPTRLAQQCCELCARLLAALGIRDMISYKQNWTRITEGPSSPWSLDL